VAEAPKRATPFRLVVLLWLAMMCARGGATLEPLTFDVAGATLDPLTICVGGRAAMRAEPVAPAEACGGRTRGDNCEDCHWTGLPSRLGGETVLPTDITCAMGKLMGRAVRIRSCAIGLCGGSSGACRGSGVCWGAMAPAGAAKILVGPTGALRVPCPGDCVLGVAGTCIREDPARAEKGKPAEERTVEGRGE